jgi:hypothetical protein
MPELAWGLGVIIDYVGNLLGAFKGDSCEYAMMLFASLYIYLSSKKMGKRLKGLMLIPVVILLLVICNPLIEKLLVGQGQQYEWQRVCWVMPVNLVLACGMTTLLIRHRDWRKRLAVCVTVFLTAALTLHYNGVWNLEHWTRVDNTLHVQSESVEVADIIMSDDREDKLCVLPDGLCLDIRSYEPGIKLLNSYRGYELYYGDEYENDQNRMYEELNVLEVPDVKWVGEWVRMYDFVYLVWDRGKVTEEQMEWLLYDKIGETEHYEIYAVRKEYLS